QTERPQEQIKADASSFFNTGNLSHELKFGAGLREATVDSRTAWGGFGVLLNGPTQVGTPINLLAVAREGRPSITTEYTSAYVQDTLTVGNLTANFGLRYDLQEGTNNASTLPAAPGPFASVLPSLNTPGGDIGFEWEDVTPRIGLTYALGAERKTLLRASYSRFADQLAQGTAGWLNLAGPSYAYFYADNPGDPNIPLSDIDFNGGVPVFGFSSNVNPFTGQFVQSNAVASDLSAPLTDELLLGIEHALLPEFVVGVNLTYRQLTNLLESELLVFDGNANSAENLTRTGRLHRRSDYIPQTVSTRSITECVPGTDCGPGNTQSRQVPLVLPDGTPYTLNYWVLRPGVSTRGGAFLENGDREQEYIGASLVFNKRLANRWMLRGNFSWSDWEWSKVPDSERESLNNLLGGGEEEGDPVLQGSGTGSGSKGGIYINSEWSYSVNGLYQVAPDRPWGFNVALNLNGRQGYPQPYFHLVAPNLANDDFRTYALQVTERPDTYRLDDIHMVDARVEKEFTFSDVGLTLGVDVFNVLNEAYILQQQHRLAVTSGNHVREISSPRIIRFGARLSFR
ncbi:MAG TPA: hypothetical protein VLE27_06895, partial [Thermoanaerobaculia bacterium]|nr:hypothetical protein [Thermoanaerobaculia bacterium]